MANYILAMGGLGMSDIPHDTVDIFKVTANGVEKVTGHGLTLSNARTGLAAASSGEYILAVGGFAPGGSYLDTVDVFKATANGVERVTGHDLSLSIQRGHLAAASSGDYILAMGGYDGSTSSYFDTVDVFHVTANGVEKITGHGLSLSVPRDALAAASCGEYILAMGGYGGSDAHGYLNTVDVFKVTSNGVEKVTGHGLTLSNARQKLAAASYGDYILAMGGWSGNPVSYFDTVDVFKRVGAQ